ncbi:MAG: hypothetical protein KY475_19365 [Planctomycetes bacterium]|nr:hypothetical protein [Planctomycetota bacterium]
MHDPQSEPISLRPPALPAWAMSLVLHAVLLVALALLLRTAPPPAAEPDRSVGIVLARRDAQDERSYFDEAATEAADDSPSAAASSSAAAALPDAAQAPPLDAALALPAADDSFLASDGALPDVTLSGKGRGRFYDGEGEEDIIAEDLARQKARGGPSGPPTEVSIFDSAPIAGRSFVFVLDRSQSMGDAGLGVLRAAEGELEHALASLKANHQFQIIAYNKTPIAFHPGGMARADGAGKDRAVAFVRDLAALGGTGHYLAISSAMRLRPDVIFLLTDGGDPRLTTPQIEQLARRAAPVTKIVCLQFGFGPAPDNSDALRILAERTGGSYSYIDMSRK